MKNNQTTPEQAERLIAFLGSRKLGFQYQVNVDPIPFGDVLEKLPKRKDGEVSWKDIEEVNYLWLPLGLTRSLQEIVRTGTTEITEPAGDNKWTTTVFTPEVNALLQFLISIFPQSQER